VASIPGLRSPFGDWEDAASRGLIVVVAIALAWYTWGRWGDFQIDCGKELYVPCEILRGKLLYRDIFYPYGPLPPYVGALLIAIFGPHLVVFYLLGIAVAIGCALLLFELGAMLEGRAAGLTAALALLFTGFGPGFANYVFPYSYAATIGLALSLICALFTLRHLSGRWGYNLLLAGFVASLALLCKVEFGAACYLMLAFVLAMEATRERSIRPLLHAVVACAPGVVLWVAIYGWFFWTVTPALMFKGNWLGPGSYFSHTGGAHLYYLNRDAVPRQMLLLILSAVLGPRLWFLLAKATRGPRNVVLAILVAIAVACRFGFLVWAARAASELLVFPEGMFFIGCGFVAYSTYELVRKGDRRRLAEAAFGIFALVPALRVFEGITPYGYGIYFAMPLFLVFAVAISRCIKVATPAFSVNQQRGLVNYLLAAEVVILALICIPQTSERLATLETSWGAVRLKPEEANVARQILAFMFERKREGRQVAVLPEAPILYALAGTEAPSRWYTLLPGFLSPAQEDVYVADLSRAAPDYILVTGRKTREYGADYFGIDYDQKIYHWIESNYRVAGQFGRFRRDETGSTTQVPLAALLYQRRDPVERNSIGALISGRPG
jgi:4-amino-4-deoxy-L-arabinose transferase-like glycosyltransferase